jgi:hypothetical protein
MIGPDARRVNSAPHSAGPRATRPHPERARAPDVPKPIATPKKTSDEIKLEKAIQLYGEKSPEVRAILSGIKPSAPPKPEKAQKPSSWTERIAQIRASGKAQVPPRTDAEIEKDIYDYALSVNKGKESEADKILAGFLNPEPEKIKAPPNSEGKIFNKDGQRRISKDGWLVPVSE